MASNPNFASTPKFVNVLVQAPSAGDTAYVNPTSFATVLTIGVGGGRLDSVYITPLGTNASTSIRFFVDTVGTGGVNNRIVYDTNLAATTSTGVTSLVSAMWRPGLVLPANSVLRATVANTAVTNGVCVSVEYSEF